MSNFGPTVPPFGPLNATILLLGEAPGSEESERGKPFVGPSGWELRRMLRTVGLNLEECYVTNVFDRQPANNNVSLYGTDLRSAYGTLGPLTLNPITFLSEEHTAHLDRLYAEIASVSPNIIVALGNTACWALGLGQGISALRGSVHTVNIPTLPRAVKVLPTFHPALVLRQWDSRVVAIADLQKAANEAHTPDLTFDNTELWLNPTLDDLSEFDAQWMSRATICAADIETKRGQITCISFAPLDGPSLAIPFWLEGEVPSYWPTVPAEREAWRWVQHWMERADLMKVFQNGLFDLQYIAKMCHPQGCTADTMLLHHSLYSELNKGLGFLGSIYGNWPSWKKLRTFKKEELIKRDD